MSPGQSKAAAAFINSRRAKGAKPQVVVISVASGLHADPGRMAEGVIGSQVVPYPFTEVGNPVVREYQKVISQLADRKFSYDSMEGFLHAKVTAIALQRAPAPATRAKLPSARPVARPTVRNGIRRLARR